MSAADRIALFKVGDRFEVSMRMSLEVMGKYLELSGDSNPVHMDAKYAGAHGFAGPIVYGNLLGAMVSQLVGMKLPTPEVIILRQNIDFRSPAYVGDDVALSATVASVHESVGSVQLKLEFNTLSSGAVATGLCVIKCL